MGVSHTTNPITAPIIMPMEDITPISLLIRTLVDISSITRDISDGYILCDICTRHYVIKYGIYFIYITI